jgi:hypothetical protein
LAVSVCLPYALTLGYRYATLPAEPTEWRQQMLAVDLPEASETLSQVQLSPGALKSGPEYAELPYWTEEQLADFRDRLEKEATSKFSVGRFVSFDELIGYVNGDETVAYEFREDDAGQVSVVKNPETSEAQDRYRKRVLLAAEILLRWSKLVRESAVAGQCDLGYLTRCAEPAHVRVVDWLLLQWQVHPGDEEIAALVAEIPRQELVDRSRRNCILSFWQNHESLKPASLPLGSSTVRGNPPQQWWLGVERMRADRSLDLAVKDALQIIEQPGAPEEWQRYTVHVRDAYLGGGFLALSDWKRADQLTRLLRERVEALKAAK